jgi:hypothetical protein
MDCFSIDWPVLLVRVIHTFRQQWYAYWYRGSNPNSGVDLFRDQVARVSCSPLLGNRYYCCRFHIAGALFAPIDAQSCGPNRLGITS